MRAPSSSIAVLSAPPPGRVLVLSPHPDDETLGCGGALILHRRQGDRVTVLFATDGGAGDPRRYYPKRDYPSLRRDEARRAGAILGVDELLFWDYPDGRLEKADGVAARLAALLAEERPDIIYRPSVLEVHPDHRALGVAAEAALRAHPLPVMDVRYEIWATVRPTHVLDITGIWHVKRKAIEQYESQLRYNDYLHKIAGLNAYRSVHVPSARYVEAFEVS